MKTKEAYKKAESILSDAGYKIKGNHIIAPKVDSPLEAISIQDQLSDIIFSDLDKDKGFHTFQLRYIGDKLQLVEVEI